MTTEVPEKKQRYVCDTLDQPFGFPQRTVNLAWLIVMHIFGLHGGWMLLSGEVDRSVWLTALFYGYFMAGLGTTVGAHRYWCHRSFKAKSPLRWFLMCAQTASGQYPIFKWSRDHRLHHKYTETDADPHNASRGFWFAHLGWLVTPEHPAVKEKEETLDLSDLDDDPIVQFQHRHYRTLFTLFVFVVPMTLNHLLFPQLSLYQLWALNFGWFLQSVHTTGLVNSAAHLWGDQPYDKSIFARQNPAVSVLAIGEGWHNYHHCFPWDYRAAEEGLSTLLFNFTWNWSTVFIDLMACLGLAYDLKTTSHKVVEERKKSGDLCKTK